MSDKMRERGLPDGEEPPAGLLHVMQSEYRHTDRTAVEHAHSQNVNYACANERLGSGS